PEAFRNTEHDGYRAKSGNCDQESPSSLSRRTTVRLGKGHGNRSDGRRSHQPAEAARPDVQNVFGVDRHQSGGPSKQDTEHVQNDCGKDDFLTPDVTKSCRQRVECQGWTLLMTVLVADSCGKEEERQCTYRGNRVIQSCATERAYKQA